MSDRALRQLLKQTQHELAQLKKQAKAGDSSLHKQLAKLTEQCAQLETSRAELDASWKERERAWHQTERRLRDELDALNPRVRLLERQLNTAQARLAKRTKAPAEVDEARVARLEVTRLERQLSLQGTRKRRR